MADVVVGVDESEGAAQALRWAVREGDLHGWTVAAVLAWGFLDQHHAIVGEAFDPTYDEHDALAALDRLLADAVGEAATARVERRPVNDLPARALLDVAAGCELLVVGARGLGGFRGLLLGSVSQHVLHHASAPVAVVRGERAAPAGGGPVVAAVDGSDAGQQALAWAVEEARVRGAPVTVVHAWHQPYLDGYPFGRDTIDEPTYERGSRRLLDEAVARCDPQGVTIERRSSQGTPAAVILGAASAAEVVVMGSRGLGGFRGMLLGSVTNQVTHHAPCPVVVVPPRS